jgi:hypothetical protein
MVKHCKDLQPNIIATNEPSINANYFIRDPLAILCELRNLQIKLSTSQSNQY